MDPSRFEGACHAASNWTRVGRTKGFARHSGSCMDPRGSPKEMFARPLRRDVRRRLADRAEWTCRAVPVRHAPSELRDVFAGLPDCRRGQGRKHRLETVLSMRVRDMFEQAKKQAPASSSSTRSVGTGAPDSAAATMSASKP